MTDVADQGDQQREVLPAFDRPPVVEVVLGFEFQPISEFGAVRLVELAERWRDQYPTVQEQPPLPMSPPVGATGQFPAMFVNVGAPAIRLWMLGADSSQLLQVQRDRLILNWRHSGDAPYPHYDDLRPRFMRAFRDLQTYVREQGLTPVFPSAVEVSYVNEIISEGASPALAGILRSQLDHPHHLGRPRAHRMSQEWDARSPHDGPATLALAAETHARGPNSTLITLTYRAALAPDATEEDVMTTMDLGHRDVVMSFAESTSDAMQEVWGRS